MPIWVQDSHLRLPLANYQLGQLESGLSLPEGNPLYFTILFSAIYFNDVLALGF
jgi:hypothetical protein